MALPQEIQDDLRQRFGLDIESSRLLGGGCIHHAKQLQTSRGTFFLKYNDLKASENFEAEARGIGILSAANELRTPHILGTGTSSRYAYLLMEFINSGPRSPRYWESFGEGLAKLHLNTQSDFGLDHANYIGALPQRNTPHQNWLSFFIQERLSPMVHLAIQHRKLPETIQAEFDRLYQKLEGIFPQEAPALLHGDLWGGNILSDEKGEACIFDPAVYYGHREMELAFMTLFDSQPSSFYDAYQEIYPLETGFERRFELYNLYPLLVHVNLFGGGYSQSVRTILKRWV